MKYIITGSTGNISKPLTEALVAGGHDITVITSKASKEAEIKALGARAAVGSVVDRDFLIRTFAGADGAYIMIPPKDDVAEWYTYQKAVADNYVAAIESNKTKYVVALSSIGAHRGHGTGPVDGAAYLEKQSAKLTDSNIVYLRPSSFYNNLFSQIGMIKQAGIVGSTQPADFKMILVDPSDIAAVAASYLLKPSFTGHSIEYIASDDSHTWAEVTKVLGTAIGKPELPYVEFTDEQSRAGMLQAGLSATISDGYIAMGKALRDGDMQAEYWAHKPKTLGKVKLEDFAKKFAGAFNAA